MKGRLFTMAMPLSALWPHSVLTLAIECFLSLSFSFLSLVIALSWLFTHVALSPPSAVDSQLQRSLRRANSCRKTNGAYCFFANGWPMHTDAALNIDCPLSIIRGQRRSSKELRRSVILHVIMHPAICWHKPFDVLRWPRMSLASGQDTI